MVKNYLEENPDYSRSGAEKNIRRALGYFAGYYDDDTRERVERLFACEHPYFGSIAKNGKPTAEQAFKLGFEAAQKLKNGEL